MRVTHRMLAHAVNRNLKNNMYALNRSSNQLSTGRMFDRPSQDPVGTYKVMRIAGTGLARNEQYRRNIGEGISWLSATEDALAGSIDAMQRLREISIYAANEVFTPADRLAIAPEVKQLLDYLVSIGNTELAGLYIFGGHQTDQKPYMIAGDNGDVIDTWHNSASGLDGNVGAGTGITVANLATGNYAVSTGAAEQVPHPAQPYFEGVVTAGPGGLTETVTLQFVVDGEEFAVTAFGGDDVPAAIANIIAAVNNDLDPAANISATGIDTNDDGQFNSIRFARTDGGDKFYVNISHSDPDIFSIKSTTDPTVKVVAEYLQGARAGFFGTDKINITSDSNDGLTGSVALEIEEAVRFEDLSGALQDQVGGDDGDRIVRLTARYLMKSVDGLENYEGTYGLRDGEDIYINLNRLSKGDQQISFEVDGQAIELNIAGQDALTYEHNIPLVGDKIVLQLTPPVAFTSTDEFDRFTLHRDYGQLDDSSRPTTGDAVSWYFKSDQSVFDNKTTVLKFFDIDPTSGNLFTSTLNAKFDTFTTAAAQEYRDREEIERYGIPDEEYGKYPAAIFTFIAAGEPYFRGDSGQRLLEIAPGIDVPSNVSGLNAFDPRGKDGVGLFRAVHDLYQALVHNDQNALGGDVLAELDINLDNLLRNRSEVGARMERFMVTEDRHLSEHLFLRELRSKIEDTDMAEIITEFSLQEVAYQAALATGASMIYPSLIDFLR